MIQVLQGKHNKPPSFLQSVLGGVAEGTPGAVNQYFQAKNKQQEQRQQSQETQRKEQSEFSRQMQLQQQKYGFEKELEAQKLKGKGPDKTQIEQDEKAQTQETAQNAFNRMSGLLKKGNLGRGSGIKSQFGGETAEDVGEFTSLGGALEALLVDKVNRGTLSNTRFEYITKNLLPNAHDSDAIIKGKLTGLAEILGLDPSELTGEAPSKNRSPSQSTKQKPPLSSFHR